MKFFTAIALLLVIASASAAESRSALYNGGLSNAHQDRASHQDRAPWGFGIDDIISGAIASGPGQSLMKELKEFIRQMAKMWKESSDEVREGITNIMEELDKISKQLEERCETTPQPQEPAKPIEQISVETAVTETSEEPDEGPVEEPAVEPAQAAEKARSSRARLSHGHAKSHSKSHNSKAKSHGNKSHKAHAKSHQKKN